MPDLWLRVEPGVHRASKQSWLHVFTPKFTRVAHTRVGEVAKLKVPKLASRGFLSVWWYVLRTVGADTQTHVPDDPEISIMTSSAAPLKRGEQRFAYVPYAAMATVDLETLTSTRGLRLLMGDIGDENANVLWISLRPPTAAAANEVKVTLGPRPFRKLGYEHPYLDRHVHDLATLHWDQFIRRSSLPPVLFADVAAPFGRVPMFTFPWAAAELGAKPGTFTEAYFLNLVAISTYHMFFRADINVMGLPPATLTEFIATLLSISIRSWWYQIDSELRKCARKEGKLCEGYSDMWSLPWWNRLAGDCEDMSMEVICHFHALRNGVWESPVLRFLREYLKLHYYCMLGITTLAKAPSKGKWSETTGKPQQQEVDFHAFATLLDRKWVRKVLLHEEEGEETKYMPAALIDATIEGVSCVAYGPVPTCTVAMCDYALPRPPKPPRPYRGITVKVPGANIFEARSPVYKRCIMLTCPELIESDGCVRIELGNHDGEHGAETMDVLHARGHESIVAHPLIHSKSDIETIRKAFLEHGFERWSPSSKYGPPMDAPSSSLLFRATLPTPVSRIRAAMTIRTQDFTIALERAMLLTLKPDEELVKTPYNFTPTQSALRLLIVAKASAES